MLMHMFSFYLEWLKTIKQLILGASIRLAKQITGLASNSAVTSEQLMPDDRGNDRQKSNNVGKDTSSKVGAAAVPVSHEPCTKPDYLRNNVRYNAADTLLLDDDEDAVMMEWEKPLMHAHASILTRNGSKRKRVLNIGFGLGIVDTALQSHEPSFHVIIEAHPTVYDKMIRDGWGNKENVRICFGRWQVEFPKLISEGLVFDGIFYDTYGEHFTDLEDFHALMAQSLSKPDGVYSFL